MISPRNWTTWAALSRMAKRGPETGKGGYHDGQGQPRSGEQSVVRKRLEEALRESEEQSEVAVPTGEFGLNPDKHDVYGSKP